MKKRLTSLFVIALLFAFVLSSVAFADVTQGIMSIHNDGGPILVPAGYKDKERVYDESKAIEEESEGNDFIIAEIYDEYYDFDEETIRKDFTRLVYRNEFLIDAINLEGAMGDVHTKADDDLAQAGEQLINAYNQIVEAKTVLDIDPEIKENLLTRFQEVSPDSKPEDYVVRDLIDVSLKPELVEYVSHHDKIRMTFYLGLTEKDVLIVLHNYEGNKWEIIPQEDVERIEDGSAKIAFKSLSPIAFIVLPEGTVQKETETVVETQGTAVAATPKGLSLWIPIAVAVLIGAGTGAAVASSGKKEKKR